MIKGDFDMQNDPSHDNKAKRDQIMAAWRDSIPPTLWNMYCGFANAGFTPEQALDLTKYVWSDMTKKGPKTEEELEL